MQEESEYELQRQKQLKENNEKLKELGLLSLPNPPIPRPTNSKSNSRPRPSPSYRREYTAIPINIPDGEKRNSRRLKGEEPEVSIEKAQVLMEIHSSKFYDNEQTRNLKLGFAEAISKLPDHPVPLPTVTIPRRAFDPELMNKVEQYKFDFNTVAFPVVLPGINVEILSLGEIVEGEDAYKYWSNKACLYHHPYPVGYRSRKYHFGKYWYQTIIKGENGPIFEVSDEEGMCYQGVSSTSAWNLYLDTERKHGGTRISGPFFFGFSEGLTISLIRRMKGYKPWNEIIK